MTVLLSGDGRCVVVYGPSWDGKWLSEKEELSVSSVSSPDFLFKEMEGKLVLLIGVLGLFAVLWITRFLLFLYKNNSSRNFLFLGFCYDVLKFGYNQTIWYNMVVHERTD